MSYSDYYVDIKDDQDNYVSIEDAQQINKLYKQCFDTDVDIGYFYYSSFAPIGVFFQLKHKETHKIIAIAKIELESEHYVFCNVCRENPKEKSEIKNLMPNFLKDCMQKLPDYVQKHECWDIEDECFQNHTFALEIENKCPYKKNAQRLYEKIGFQKANITLEGTCVKPEECECYVLSK